MGEKVIRDPVWGDMVLDGDTEMRLVDTPEFQRMRGIKQLGTACLVYTGAHHTRFEHSMGTAHVARRILDALEKTGAVIDERDRKLIGVAALLHDVTHIPFGHTFEDERRIWDRHDTPERTAEFLEAGELGRRLRAMGMAQEVLAILNRDLPPERAWVHEVISGTICADLLDYLARDAFYSGIAARWDERVFRTFVLGGGRLAVNAEKRGIIREDVLTEVVNLLRLRYTLSERVYFHHAKVSSGAMISKAVELAVEDGLELRDLYALRDEGLFSMLRSRFAKKNRVLKLLLDRFDARELHKRCYVLTTRVPEAKRKALIERYHLDRNRREQAEADLERAVKVDPGDVIIYCPAMKMQLKEARIPVRLGRAGTRPLAELGIKEIESLHEKHRDLWKLYVFLAGDKRERGMELSAACEVMFGEPNELEGLGQGQMRLGFG